MLGWLAVRTAPAVDAKAQLPGEVPRPPSNTVYNRIDLNHCSVRDFGRHGQDLDRVCEDIREDFCGEHGLAEIDRRIHSAHAVDELLEGAARAALLLAKAAANRRAL